MIAQIYTLLLKLQFRLLIPALNAWACTIATPFGHGYMDDLTTERSFDSKATWVIDVLGLFLSMGVCTTMYRQTSGRLVQE